MTKTDQTSAGLFAIAAGLLAAGFYAAGVWVAIYCAAFTAWQCFLTRRADRPETVSELAAIKETLREIQNRQQFLVTSFSAAFPARQGGPSASPMRSPIRPPVPR